MPNLVPVSLSLWAGIYQVLFARVVGAPVVRDERVRHGGVRASSSTQFAIRSTVLPPAAMTMLSDDDRISSLAPLRYVRSITAPLSPLQARRFRDRFGIAVLNCYGQTEIGGEIIGWTGADSKAHGDDKLGAVGRPHAGVEVRVDRADRRAPGAHARPLGGLRRRPRPQRSADRRRLVPHRRRRPRRSRGVRVDRRTAQRHDQPRWPEGLPGGGRGGAAPVAGRRRRARSRAPRRSTR